MTTKEQKLELSEKELEFIRSFRFMDIVARALQEVHDGADETTITATLSKLEEKFLSCDAALKALPGGSMTRHHQMTEVKSLKENLENKQFLLGQLYSKHDLISRVLAQRAIPEGRPVDGVNSELVFPPEPAEGMVGVADDDPMMGLEL
ncbi:hypothetical protein BWQ96_06238 [Gracilariopsis chorda]|uniref:Uncharacterized protein n=1 Tax=Gracilariopsis chorda TaxID=448386 RepID=A0A2V3IPI9_9FLOR|nr:hypothetical protein BWQ96_06238 [Gracilariopsis chorda]|eukprot:PXF44005.1 hypothetical protein BWQ96_06238 [Gracilariopsis chorda]